jgi:hypothetical protein
LIPTKIIPNSPHEAFYDELYKPGPPYLSSDTIRIVDARIYISQSQSGIELNESIAAMVHFPSLYHTSYPPVCDEPHIDRI